MPDLRTNKSVSERFDTEFNWRPESGLRRWRRTLAWVCLLLPLLLLGVYEVVGDGRYYWADPLTEAHQAAFVGERVKGQVGCKICHTKMAQPLWRLVTWSNLPCSVDDASCLNCHVERHEIRPKDHHPTMRDEDVRGCAVCHEEHRGRNVDLTKVADRRCVECHSELHTNQGEPQFYAHVASFAAHPEFAASRFRDGKAIAANDKPSPKHGVFASAEFDGEKLVDKTPLYFNHAAHLNRDGVLRRGVEDQDPSRDQTRERDKVYTDKNQLMWEKLECADCHKLDGQGEYRMALQYERHCSRCHPLAFSEKLSGPAQGPLPHDKLSRVFSDARTRLRDYFQRPPRAASEAESEGDEPRLPSKRKEATEGTLDERVNLAWPDIKNLIVGGCAHCHQFTAAPPGGEFPLEVVPPKVPDRWLPHSKFRHDKHKEYTCVLCHDIHSPREKLQYVVGTDSDQDRTLESRETSDILMPSVSVCQECHVSGTKPVSKIPAKADCIECHVYHHRPSAAY